MNTRIDQLLHGYRRGHEHLAGSVKLPAKDADLVTRLSDLSGTPTGREVFSPYLTAYPLPSGLHFALAQTWPDLGAARSGCVLTHTLLIPSAYWRTLPEPKGATLLFRSPVGRKNNEAYEKPLQWSSNPLPVDSRPQSALSDATAKFVHLYFAKGKRPVVWFDHPQPEDAFWRILQALWPALRARFTVCTHCLQPRSLDDRPFDLMFADGDASPRFLKIDRDNIIEFKSNDSGKTVEEWSRRWADRIFKPASSDDLLDADLFNDLDDDPTAIRRLYLIDSALRNQADAPQAAVGAMDLVESVARQANVAIGTKTRVARRAVAIANEAKNSSDSIECLRLIEDRLKRPAYSMTATQISPLIVDAVADRTERDPELVALLPPSSYDVASEDAPSSFLTGVIEGFRRLIEQNSNSIAALRYLPHVAARLFEANPKNVQSFTRALVERRTEPAVRQSIHEFLSSKSDISNSLRGSLLGDFNRSDLDLLSDLVAQLPEDQVTTALDAISSFLQNDAVRRDIQHTLLQSFPVEVRRWALSQSMWTLEVAALAAATFAPSRDGLTDLLSLELPSNRQSVLLVQYLLPLGRGRFPAWTRKAVVEDDRLFSSLLSNDLQSSQQADALVSQLLNEGEDLKLAHLSTCRDSLANHKGRTFYTQLADHVCSNLLRGYLEGTIPEGSCLSLLQSEEMSEWVKSKDTDSLSSLLSYQVWNRRDNWLNAWKLLHLMPESLYSREHSVVLNVVDALIRAYYPAWSSVVAHTWVCILRRVRKECPSWRVQLQLKVQGLKHAIYNSRFPLSEVVVETFGDIYKAVTSPGGIPSETASLFGMFDWDKGKELRKALIDTFMSSQWPAGDLVLASSERILFRKIFKRVYRKPTGPRYLQAALRDLQSRSSNEAMHMAGILSALLREPDFYEDWD